MYSGKQKRKTLITDGSECFLRGEGMRLKTNPDYKYREIAGMHYLIPCGRAASRSETPIQLTETAAWIWNRIEKEMDREEIIVCMTQEFEVDRETARKAVTGFSDMLLQQGMAAAANDTEKRQNP